MKLNVGMKDWKNGTNILDLDVPPQLERTVKTGVAFWDGNSTAACPNCEWVGDYQEAYVFNQRHDR